MAKRFIDTNIFNDSWLSNLEPEYKLFYIWLITNCDHAGIIDLNLKLAEFQIGIKGLIDNFNTIKEIFNGRLVNLRDNYYFLPKFIKYQYSKGLNENVKAHDSVIKRLNEFNLSYKSIYKELDNSSQTLNELLNNSSVTVQDKDIEKDKDKVIDQIKEILINNDEKLNFETFYKLYPGTKRNYDTEYENYKKKYKNWKDLLPQLFSGLEKQIKSKIILKNNEKFVPGWKHLKTYINNRSWEEVIPTNISEQLNQVNKSNSLEDTINSRKKALGVD